MDYPMAGHTKLCGTCEFWVGPRQPNFYGNTVMLPAQNTKGNCWCLTCPYARMEKYSNTTTCMYYKKWSVLK